MVWVGARFFFFFLTHTFGTAARAAKKQILAGRPKRRAKKTIGPSFRSPGAGAPFYLAGEFFSQEND